MSSGSHSGPFCPLLIVRNWLMTQPLLPLVFSSVKWTQEQGVTELGTTASFRVAVGRVAVEMQEWMFVEDFPGSSGLGLPTALTGGQPRRGSG